MVTLRSVRFLASWPPAALVLVLGSAAGCSGGPPAPAPPEPAPVTPPRVAPSTPETPRPLPVAASTPRDPPSAPTPAETAVAAPPPPSIEARFLPRDTTCRKDADCAVTQSGLDERFYCCDPCESLPGNRTWVARADAACRAYPKGAPLHVCPPRDCGPPGPAFCDDGQCAFTGCFLGAKLSRAPSEEGDPVVRCVLPDGTLHGRATFYYPGSKQKEMVGSYSHGEPCGVWTFWDPQGATRVERKKPCLP